MAQNVEIKARLSNVTSTEAIAQGLSDTACEIIHQEDVFFGCSDGRLKLRIFSPDSGQLIFYRRSNMAGPKVSEYYITNTSEPATLSSVLDKANGTTGVVVKERHLYLVGRTRIHIDRVKNLGDFLELEVVLTDGEDLKIGELEAEQLMQKLNIRKSDLVECAYFDLLQAREI